MSRGMDLGEHIILSDFIAWCQSLKRGTHVHFHNGTRIGDARNWTGISMMEIIMAVFAKLGGIVWWIHLIGKDMKSGKWIQYPPIHLEEANEQHLRMWLMYQKLQEGPLSANILDDIHTGPINVRNLVLPKTILF